MKKYFLGFFLFAFLFVMACGSDDGGKDGNGSDGGSDLCKKLGNPCSKGQYCFNGLCIPGCTSNDNCDSDKYCSIDEITQQGYCAGKQVIGCQSNSDCTSPQVCKQGLCSVQDPESPTCEWMPNGEDGCSSYEVCIEEEEGKGKCYSLPPCAENNTCPVGQIGAVCNEDIITTKARICLLGMCKETGHCPSSWKCVMFPGYNFGACSSGQMGMLCSSNDDCAQGLECMILPGTSGTCAPSMGGF